MVNADNCASEIAMGILYGLAVGGASKSLGEGLGNIGGGVVDTVGGVAAEAAGDILGTVGETADQLLVRW